MGRRPRYGDCVTCGQVAEGGGEMASGLRIERLTVIEFAYELADLGVDYNGFNTVYAPGATRRVTGHVFVIDTSEGIRGEHVGGDRNTYAQVSQVAHYLVGRNPLERERIYNDVKRALRKVDKFGLSAIDIALWDIAGKAYGAPLYELLGGWKRTLPAYASTLHGDHVRHGGLSTPEAFADFALQCREMGYPAFKIHGWGNDPSQEGYIHREVATVLGTRAAVGESLDLMLDPACEYDTWADALRVGRACDEAVYFWYEDPYKDGGVSAFAHKRLRELIKTPLLLGEHVRNFEQHVDFSLAGGTDFLRADAHYDGGVTGLMKIAHAAEGLGMDVEIHAPTPEHRHCMASIRNTNYYELGLVHPKIKTTRPPVYVDYSDDLEAVDRHGHVPVPQGPGLGVSIDWDWVHRHETGRVSYP